MTGSRYRFRDRATVIDVDEVIGRTPLLVTIQQALELETGSTDRARFLVRHTVIGLLDTVGDEYIRYLWGKLSLISMSWVTMSGMIEGGGVSFGDRDRTAGIPALLSARLVKIVPDAERMIEEVLKRPDGTLEPAPGPDQLGTIVERLHAALPDAWVRDLSNELVDKIIAKRLLPTLLAQRTKNATADETLRSTNVILFPQDRRK